ncbi:galactose mutarotase [Thalassospira sp. HF15]|uniref:aldose epimerase family protein n=1 Tax=Thalassospira sp. HF15 TaxID=2722755 RepID=UPI00143003FB|nr:aldose epimerase family protein [Thalassospira sp. HF15]NIY74028.1 galactose mutarotase [Thalassospira sp. HF15]
MAKPKIAALKKGENAPRAALESPQIRVLVSALGARLCEVYLKDPEDGNETSIAVNLADDAAYLDQDSYIGAVCGRYANRIEAARFPDQNGKMVQLAANEGETHLHGGPDGFDRRVWTISDQTDRSVTFELTSPDGDQGYPGTMTAQATYSLVADDRIRLEITATCDQPCPVNMTSHAYWNLRGKFDQSAADHVLQINADQWLPVDDKLIPDGPAQNVAGTGYNFQKPAKISANLPNAKQGYDHNFCLTGARGDLRQIATLSAPDSNRSIKLFSTEAGLQFYLSQHFNEAMKTENGVSLHPSGGIALEPQTYPNSPNREDFPSPWLKPGETYRHVIEWEFS